LARKQLTATAIGETAETSHGRKFLSGLKQNSFKTVLKLVYLSFISVLF